ncbi:probable endo-1,3(4)-beta-glucanase NFIA_089530 [Aspergillus lentulus]|uniref:endo-1,3(4)-beta-glucanase n=1 Tax=Aspergillus lentulus TaxID=293939 RepID=A0ABQ0ZX13_ASPLE|nr:probable endo-1,3(4)-beta-glucanase NFIA_089530 [Aspergillus lentulus]
MAPSSLLLSVGSLIASSLVSATALEARQSQTYQLAESWQGESFINDWNFFNGADPTNGYVTYVNQSFAEQSGLVKVTQSGSFYMGVDYESTLNPNGPGRESVRIETKNYYTEGLCVIDIEHMPGSICGTWPAFWSVGKDWPNDGEIDIIEGVNLQKANEIVLHTSGSCDVSGSNDMTGTLSSSECGEASGTVGCVVKGTNGSSGDPFNKAGGGVYAMEWTDAFIKIWFFPRSQIPASLSSGSPDTSSFGTPMAHLQGSCDFGERFKAQKFIIDTTFCGDWAGNVFAESTCPMSDPSSPMQSCVNYVAQNPAAFKEAYWEINSIKVYQYGVSAASTAAVSQATTSQVEGTLVSVQISNTATPTVPVPAETTAAPPAAQTNTVVEGTAANHATQSSVESTTVPAVTPATTAPTASAAEGGDAELESTSTVYVTSTTTICPVAESSSATAAGGKKDASSNEDSGGEVVATSIAATPVAAASEHPGADAIANSAAAISTVTKSEAVASRLTAGALSEIPTAPPEPVSQAVSTGSFDDSDTAPSHFEEHGSIASASAAPSTIPVPASSSAAALGGSSIASSFASSRRVPSPTGSSTAASVTAIATWSPTAGERASGTAKGSATLTAPSEVVFTPGLSNGANRMSVGLSGLIGVMFIAALA